jgi:hypothetical protein
VLKNKGFIRISRRGFILVGCLTLVCAAAVIAVTGSFNKITRELAADELRWHSDAQAQLSAESGLMIGANVFRNSGLTTGPVKMNFDGSEITLELTENGAKDGYVRIISTARHADLAYDKRVEVQVKAEKKSLPNGTFEFLPVFDSGDTASAALVKTGWREANIPRQ